MQNNLDTKLTRIENTIGLMKHNLGLEENTIIEDVATATNLHSLSNFFIQEEEPEIKDGIWIKADKDTHPYDDIRFGGDVVIPGVWRHDLAVKGSYVSKDTNTNPGQRTLMLNGQIYSTVSTGNSNYSLYQVDPHTGVQTSLGSLGYGVTHLWTHGGAIYARTSTTIVKYVGSTKTTLGLGGSTPVRATCNDEYIFAISSDYLYRFDWATVTRQYWSNPARKGGAANASRVMYMHPLDNNRVLILWGAGADNNKYWNGVFDCSTGEFTNYGDTTLNRVLVNGGTFSTWTMGDQLYTAFFEDAADGNKPTATKGVFKIDLQNFTYEEVTDQFFDDNFTELYSIMLDGDKYYALDKRANSFIVPQDSDSVQYDTNSIVIFQTPLSKTEKQTAIWTYPNLKGRMLFSFYDIYYYNKETGFDFTLPMYYGDGERWIKFKG